MKIYNETLNDILNHMPAGPPEAGGIMGGKDGKVSLWKYDAGYSSNGCFYCPNVNFLNEVIAAWMDKSYEFMGILHVHFGGSKMLSDGDKKYIEKIMKAMPDFIERLYFPIIVQPERELVSHVVYQNLRKEVVIEEDEVEVLYEKEGFVWRKKER